MNISMNLLTYLRVRRLMEISTQNENITLKYFVQELTVQINISEFIF